MDLKKIQKQLDKVMEEENNRSIPEFEGYSPLEMHKILHFTFAPESPIKLQKLNASDYQMIPMLNQIKFLTDLIQKAGEIKLTNKGFLPTRVVSELYHQGFLKDEHIELGISKLYKETDSLAVNLTRIIVQLAGLTKKRKGKISLTKGGEEMIGDDFRLLQSILETFATKFNWAYCDGFGDNHIGQLGYGFSLILLSKYGAEKRLDSFYAEKYFKAYPQLLGQITPRFGTLESYSARCYSLRTFERFIYYFGLISIDKQGMGLHSKEYITKTNLFDKLINVRPPKRPSGT
ncbi:MAG: hypothetical protein KDC80_29875 [Saprospiraceae bacterium]|nr:hypothetical protein [Saprospiraceae bacterium]